MNDKENGIDWEKVKDDMKGITRFGFYTAFWFVLMSFLDGNITPFSAIMSLYMGLMTIMAIGIVDGLYDRYSKPKPEKVKERGRG